MFWTVYRNVKPVIYDYSVITRIESRRGSRAEGKQEATVLLTSLNSFPTLKPNVYQLYQFRKFYINASSLSRPNSFYLGTYSRLWNWNSTIKGCFKALPGLSRLQIGLSNHDRQFSYIREQWMCFILDFEIYLVWKKKRTRNYTQRRIVSLKCRQVIACVFFFCFVYLNRFVLKLASFLYGQYGYIVCKMRTRIK